MIVGRPKVCRHIVGIVEVAYCCRKVGLPREQDVFSGRSEVALVLLREGRDREGVPSNRV